MNAEQQRKPMNQYHRVEVITGWSSEIAMSFPVRLTRELSGGINREAIDPSA
jgi:hypothetical protein